MLLLTLRGTPTIYYGDEIGMDNFEIPPGRLRDPFELNVPGRGFGRDPQRTPMQWHAGENAGFTSGGSPWLPVASDAPVVNVEEEAANDSSMLPKLPKCRFPAAAVSCCPRTAAVMGNPYERPCTSAGTRGS